jgi:lipopolysaccharide export system permease protein
MSALQQFFHRYFSIIDRYLLREFSVNLFAIVLVLWLIYIATRFARYLAQAAVGNLPSEVIFTLLGYSSLGALDILLPIAAFLAVMLALGRMNSDSELTVIAACGISSQRVMRNVLVFAASISVVVAVLSLVIVPDVLANRYELEQKAKVAADTSGLVAGNFKESKNGDWTFYAESLANDNQTMENIFIEIHRQDRPMIFRAQQGQFEIDDNSGDKFLVLKNGYRYQGEAGQQDFIIAKFETHNLLVEKGGDKQVREKHKSLPTSILWDRASNKDLSELQWRIATAVMTIVLCLFAIKLSDTGPRKGRYAGFFPAILLYIVYSNLLAVNKTWIDKGVLTPWLGSVWVHVVMLLILWALLNQRKLLLMVSAYKQAKGKAI